jgi:hypothetical protein
MKKLIVFVAAIFACAFQPAVAAEKVDSPFLYTLKTMNISPDTAYWGITGNVVIPDLMISQSPSKAWLFTGFNGVGAGLNYGRYVESHGSAYETFGGDVFMIYNPEKKELCFASGFSMLNRKLGVCGGIKIINETVGQTWFVGLTTGWKPY